MNEAKLIEQYLQNQLPAEEQLLMQARLLTDAQLREQLRWQQQTYALVQAYGRSSLRKEILAAEVCVFSQPRFRAFREQINRIFNKRS